METDMSDTDYDAAFEKYEQQIELLQVALAAERDKVEKLTDDLHLCNGTADLAMKHRDIAEAELAALRSKLDAAEAALREIVNHRSVSWGSNQMKSIARAALSRQEGGQGD
jgi:chromosome segregation ATPase